MPPIAGARQTTKKLGPVPKNKSVRLKTTERVECRGGQRSWVREVTRSTLALAEVNYVCRSIGSLRAPANKRTLRVKGESFEGTGKLRELEW